MEVSGNLFLSNLSMYLVAVSGLSRTRGHFQTGGRLEQKACRAGVVQSERSSSARLMPLNVISQLQSILAVSI